MPSWAVLSIGVIKVNQRCGVVDVDFGRVYSGQIKQAAPSAGTNLATFSWMCACVWSGLSGLVRVYFLFFYFSSPLASCARILAARMVHF